MAVWVMVMGSLAVDMVSCDGLCWLVDCVVCAKLNNEEIQ